MPRERPHRRRVWKRRGLAAFEQLREREPDAEPRGRALDVAFDARDLPREEDPRFPAHPEEAVEVRRRVNVGVAVQHPESNELRALEPWNRAEDALLLGNLELRLEPDEVVVLAREIVLAQLHDGPRDLPGAGVGKTHGLHRPVAERLGPAFGHHLDRQAALEVDPLLEVLHRHRLGGEQRHDERLVLRAIERRIPVILAASLAVAREGVHLREVERGRGYDRRDRIVEVQVTGPEQLSDRRVERRRRQRSRGEDDVAVGRNCARLLADELDLGPRRQRLGDESGEDVAVHREGVARRHGRPPGAPDHERVERLHLPLQEPDRVGGIVGAEGIRADELGASVRPVRDGRDARAHLDQPDAVPAPRELPGALRAGEAGADDRHPIGHGRNSTTRPANGGLLEWLYQN